MKMKPLFLLIFLIPIQASAQTSNPLSRCDSGDKFQRMECMEKVERSARGRMVGLENKVISGLNVLDNQFRNMKWPDGSSVRFSNEFRDAQRIWREFTEKDCRAETAVSFDGNGWGSIMQECIIRRYLVRERTLQTRLKEFAPSNLVEISGQLSYPSEYIPGDLKVCAQQINNPANSFCTQDKFQVANRLIYRLNVPLGEYYVFASTKDMPNYKAYYTEAVTCGLHAHCKSHRKIKVILDGKNQKISNINPQDWYE
jgi:uncharacterized protein YecT (DUF1311 family)